MTTRVVGDLKPSANALESWPFSTVQTPSDANRIAHERTDRDYISFSSIKTYQACPLRYYLAYVARVPAESVSASLVFGSAMHAAVEAHYRARLAGERSLDVAQQLKVYDSVWKAEATAPLRYAKGESAESLRGLAERMLTAFRASPPADPDATILGVEEEFRAAVIPNCPDLVGRLDLILLDASGLRIVDFKTARGRWNETNITEALPQMLLYSELVRPLARACGDVPIRLEWIVATKTQKPVVELHTACPKPYLVARTRNTVQRVWQAIRAGHFFPSPSPMGCAACPYANACRQWEG